MENENKMKNKGKYQLNAKMILKIMQKIHEMHNIFTLL